MPDTVSEECESERHHTQDLFRCVGCAVRMFLQTRSLSSRVHWEAGEPFATETVLDHEEVRRFDISSDTASIQSRDHQEEAGSVASGDENVEVPVVEMVPLVRPTAAVLRQHSLGWTSGIWRKCFRIEER